MDECLVIDIGTSSLRVLVMEPGGAILRAQVQKRALPAVFDAEETWARIVEMARALSGDFPAPRAVAVSALLGWVGADGDGRAVTPCCSYMHQCPEEYGAFRAQNPDLPVYQLCGRRANPELGAFQLLRLRARAPEAYRRMSKLLSLKDFINLKLTGAAAMDRTTACYTMACDAAKGAWSAPLLDALGLDGEKLPPLRDPWEALAPLSGDAARALGLAPGTPVAVGSVDGSTGILGAGGVEPGTLVSVMGTTDTSFLVTDAPMRDPARALVSNPHVIPGRWLLGGPMGMYGGAVDWFLSNLLAGARSAGELTALAAALPRGSGGVRFFPTLAGERVPFWEPALRGTVTGMERRHRAEHLFRAILEANAYAVRRLAELARGAGAELERCVAIGGGAKNDLWLQIRAEVLGAPQIRTGVEEATARGSCMLALLATGAALDQLPVPPAAHTFSCGEAGAGEEYRALYGEYLALHDQVAALYRPAPTL